MSVNKTIRGGVVFKPVEIGWGGGDVIWLKTLEIKNKNTYYIKNKNNKNKNNKNKKIFN